MPKVVVFCNQGEASMPRVMVIYPQSGEMSMPGGHGYLPPLVQACQPHHAGQPTPRPLVEGGGGMRGRWVVWLIRTQRSAEWNPWWELPEGAGTDDATAQGRGVGGREGPGTPPAPPLPSFPAKPHPPPGR